jgi:uncharacterized membrane protein YuzA (DUF378 family)
MSILGSRMLTGSILAVIGLITVKVLGTVFGAIMAFLSFLFFTVLPIAFVAWLVMKLLRSLTREKKKPAYE